MTNRFLITNRPVQIVAGGAAKKPTLLVNQGPEPVYLSDQVGVTRLTGIPLGPGFSVSWDPDLNLWAVSESDEPVTVILAVMNTSFQQVF